MPVRFTVEEILVLKKAALEIEAFVRAASKGYEDYVDKHKVVAKRSAATICSFMRSLTQAEITVKG